MYTFITNSKTLQTCYRMYEGYKSTNLIMINDQKRHFINIYLISNMMYVFTALQR